MSGQNHSGTDRVLLKTDDTGTPTFLHEILFASKRLYQKLSGSVEHYQLRHILVQLSEERVSLIRSLDIALTLNSEELISVNEPKRYQAILRYIESSQIENIQDIEESRVYDSIIKCEKEILKLVKTLLLASRQQALRHLLSSLAASIQIGLDKLELLEL